ncbi:MAG: hypothetical protein IPL99_29665 [Candidatus Competibacteraceae bacterium]|nr:hypothetical protein [Candidatus Competibacteraceae bacterium]
MIYNNAACGEGCARSENVEIQSDRALLDSIQAALGGSPDKPLSFDGKPHRFKIDASRDAGWYIAHLNNGTPTLICGDWRQGPDGPRYKFGGHSSDTVVGGREDRERQQRERQQRATQANRTAKLATGLWESAPRATEHPYLDRKRIEPGHLRLLTPSVIQRQAPWFQSWCADHDLPGALLVPMYRNKRIVDLQLINAAGAKLFLPKGDHTGAFMVLGKPSPDQPLIIATGFATCVSLRECTKSTVVCAFSDGNLEAVVAAFRAAYPDTPITIAADNDLHADPTKINSGVRYGSFAARKHHCLLAVPHLDGLKCDYNDLFVAKGQQAVVESIARARPVTSTAPVISAATASKQLQAELTDWLNLGGDLAIKGAAGLGKSTMVLPMIVARHLRCDYFVPSHALAQEQADRLPPGVAIAIRGRTHQTPTQPPLCQKHEAATALEKAGLGHQTMPLLCGKIDPKTGKRPCPYAAQCGYLQQFQSPAPIRFYAHEYLPLPAENRLTKREIDVAVIDESFRDALEKRRRWSLGELSAQPETVYHDLATAIIEGRLLSMNAALPEIDRLLDQESDQSVRVHPEMDATHAANVCKPLVDRERKPISFLWNCKQAIEANHDQRLWFANVDNGAIFAAWRKPITFVADATPKAFLDASLSARIIKAVSPNCRIVEIQASRQAHITQITDSAMSHRRLLDDNDYMSSRLLELVQRKAREHGPNGAVIAPLKWIEAHGHRLPARIKTAHFGGLRGLNELEQCDWLIQIGRFQPPPHAVESAARAWFPELHLNLGGGYLQERRELSAKNGDGAYVWTHSHIDPRCRELLESIREEESLQAIDRLRLVHAQQAKHIYLISNLPLPGIEPDALTTLDAVTLPGRIAEVALRDGVIMTGIKELATRHPDLFPTEKSAHRELRSYREELVFIGAVSNISIIRNRTNETDKPFSYRLSGSRGGVSKSAIIPYGVTRVDAAEILTKIHGKSVIFLEQPDPPMPATVQWVAPVPEPEPATVEAPAPEPIPIEERITARKAALMAAGWSPWNAEARARDDMARMAEVAA